MINSFRSYFKTGNRSAWAVFLVFSLSIFIQLIIYHSFSFRTFGGNLWHSPVAFVAFWFPKLAISCCLASFVLLTRYKSWSIILSIAISIWMIANLLYFRANDIFLTYEAIGMAGKLKGTGGSMWLYMNWNYLWLFFVNICYIFLFLLVRGKARSWRGWLITILASGVLSVLGGLAIYHQYKDSDTVHFSNLRGNPKATVILPLVGDKDEVREYGKTYFYHHGILSHIHTLHRYRYRQLDTALTEREQAYLNSRIDTTAIDSARQTPKSNLIVIFVESMETWPIDLKDQNGNDYLPNFNKFLHTKAQFYADHVKPEVRHGVSGDGQLIMNTGLLPLHSGAACMLYGDNVYPNFAGSFTQSILFNPQTVFWNKDVAFRSYGYTSIIQPDTVTERWSDEQLFDSLSVVVKQAKAEEKLCLFMLPLAPHTPFLAVSRTEEQMGISFPKSMPLQLRNYLTCLHYTDSCFGAFMDNKDNSEFINNSTIVVTGDHTVFRDMLMHEFHDYAVEANLPFKTGRNYCPLMIYSPSLQKQEQTILTDEVYQMDMFPTVMYLLGLDDYWFKGFGVNLIKYNQETQSSSSTRTMTEQEIFTLSDKLIRQNYFQDIVK